MLKDRKHSSATGYLSGSTALCREPSLTPHLDMCCCCCCILLVAYNTTGLEVGFFRDPCQDRGSKAGGDKMARGA